MQSEKRLFKRVQVPDDALYIFCKDSSIKGWVTDISSGGLAFGYISAENSPSKSEFKLILAGNKVSVYLPDIACKIVYDQAADKGIKRFTGAVTRRCGVQFVKLNVETKQKLKGIMMGTQPIY